MCSLMKLFNLLNRDIEGQKQQNILYTMII